jgi:hypothetical protein
MCTVAAQEDLKEQAPQTSGILFGRDQRRIGVGGPNRLHGVSLPNTAVHRKIR